MSSLPVGTTVKLEGLSSAEYNGKKGIIAVTAPDIAARGRVAVIVDGATLSFKRANVRRYFPSDDSDESDEEDEAAPPPPKRAAGGTFVLTILTGWSSIEGRLRGQHVGQGAEGQGDGRARVGEALRGRQGKHDSPGPADVSGVALAATRVRCAIVAPFAMIARLK